MSKSHLHDVLIIGSGAAGLSLALVDVLQPGLMKTVRVVKQAG